MKEEFIRKMKSKTEESASIFFLTGQTRFCYDGEIERKTMEKEFGEGEEKE